MIRIQSEEIRVSDALSEFCQDRTDIGATVVFTGRVRDATDGADVSTLTLEHYPGFTESEIKKIETRAHEKWRLGETLIIHRYGELAPGETIVLVATAAAHRRDAFEAAEFLMDYLKTDAPFWKKEVGPSGARWIEPRDDDKDARKRW